MFAVNNFLKIKTGSILLFVSIFLVFVFLLKKSDDKPSVETALSKTGTLDKTFVDLDLNIEAHKVRAVVEPTSLIKQQGKINGINPPVKFEKDLETSLKIQKIPDIWLEYIDDKNQIIKVELPEKAMEFIKKRWLGTLQYSFQNQSTDESEIKFNINKNYINDAAVYATKIDDFEITTPLEKRNISTEEAFAIVNLTAKLAIQRYEELKNMAAHVKPQKIGE
jgi:hypothetical protein